MEHAMDACNQSEPAGCCSAASEPGAPLTTRPGSELSPSSIHAATAVCVFLLLAIAVVFAQTVNFDFVNFDDDLYIGSPHVSRGLTAEGIVWAFTTNHCANWHPVTWISHMLDCQVYGQYAGGHHLTNVLLHAATAVLLFLVFRQMTGQLWPSAFVAAVFAIHPLRVESVAWVSERKDILSGLFFMLCLGAYVGYARHPFSWARYLTVLALFFLGLMAKPMLVTLPFVLLLLDYWPLGRMERGTGFSLPVRLVYEKIPLVVLAAASCAATLWAQTVAIAGNEHLPLGVRMANAAVSYAGYIYQTFYPAGLAVFYPFQPDGVSLWHVGGALLLLLGITAAAVVFGRRCPWLPVGWFWYLGMLVPVIGLVQVGGQSMADRYTYLPQIGLAIVVAWGAQRVLESWPGRAWVWGVAAAATLGALIAVAYSQTSTWRDSETLWKHTLDCTSNNARAHDSLGNALARRGNVDEAIAHYRRSLEINAGNAEVHYNLGLALAGADQSDEAIAQLGEALQLNPEHAGAHSALGIALARCGRLNEAIRHFQKAVEIVPDEAAAHNNLGSALLYCGRVDEAIAQYQRALEIRPDLVDARANLDHALALKRGAN